MLRNGPCVYSNSGCVLASKPDGFLWSVDALTGELNYAVQFMNKKKPISLGDLHILDKNTTPVNQGDQSSLS